MTSRAILRETIKKGQIGIKSRPLLPLTAELAVVEAHGTEKQMSHMQRIKGCGPKPTAVGVFAGKENALLRTKLSNLSNQLIQRVGKSYPQGLMWQQGQGGDVIARP